MTNPKYLIRICCGPRCKENFSNDLLKVANKSANDNDEIEVERRGCMAICEKGPNVEVIKMPEKTSTVYSGVMPDQLVEIIKELT